MNKTIARSGRRVCVKVCFQDTRSADRASSMIMLTVYSGNNFSLQRNAGILKKKWIF